VNGEKIYGDNGIDFFINGWKVDIKTSMKPYNLLLKVSDTKNRADILVLGGLYMEPKPRVAIIGWEYRENVKKKEPRDFGGFPGNFCHPMHRNEIKKMDELVDLVGEPHTWPKEISMESKIYHKKYDTGERT
jgi:hypothetical protein